MAHVGRRLNPADERLGRLVRDVRVALGWSQRDLGRRVGRSQSWLSRAERGLIPDMSAARVERILAAMGARLLIDVDAPFLADRRRQREPAHARTSGHVAMRLRSAGWLAETEVEIGDGRRRGWIDVLAWHPHTGLLLIIEIKTEIHDLGAIQRTLAWYEREAWAAARRLGWRPRMIHGSLLLLATEANDQRALANAEGLAAAFPLSAAELASAVATGAIGPDRGDRSRWWIPARVDRRGSGRCASMAGAVRHPMGTTRRFYADRGHGRARAGPAMRGKGAVDGSSRVPDAQRRINVGGSVRGHVADCADPGPTPARRQPS